MNRLFHSIAVSGVAAFCLAGAASAATLNSIDFTPVSGTWGSPSVQLDFGPGHGLGTISFASVNGGAFVNASTPFAYNGGGYSSYSGPTLLSNGDLFSPTEESVFIVNPSGNAGLSGFTMTVTLAHGSFLPGSVFSVRSLGRTNDQFQYFQPGTGLGMPDSVQLPTDGSVNPNLVLIDAARNLYGAAANTGASKGLAFGITGGTFTASFLSTTSYQPGGVAFTIALPSPVPEPTSVALLLAGLCTVGFMARRRAKAAG